MFPFKIWQTPYVSDRQGNFNVSSIYNDPVQNLTGAGSIPLRPFTGAKEKPTPVFSSFTGVVVTSVSGAGSAAPLFKLYNPLNAEIYNQSPAGG